MTTAPSVSVIIATRDRPELLRRAIDSILAQDYAGPVEVVVVFDQTEPDNTLAWAEGNRSVRVTTNQHTPGLAGARNTGAEATTGELLAFCDDDDTWLPEKLTVQAAALEEAGADVAVAGIYVHYGERVTIRVPTAEEMTVAELARSRVMSAHPSSVLVRRAAFFDRIGPVDEKIPGSHGEDWDWILRAAESSSIAVVPRPLVRVLWHPGGSFFSRRWLTIIDAHDYLIDKHPVLRSDPRGLARLYGQKAFAYAAAGQPGDARHWAKETLRLSWRERRAYLALLVAAHIIPAKTVMRLANAAGRGI